MSSAQDLKVDKHYHMGHLLYEKLLANPDYVCQIDAGAGQTETYASVLNRTVRLAKCFRRSGLKVGDVLALGGKNHLDVHIPYYAAILCGLPITGVDPLHKYDEIKASFELTEPKIAFCQSEIFADTARAVKDLGLDTRIITFDEGEHSLNTFLESYHDDSDCEEFKPSEFNGEETILWLISTSGTTGVIKFAIFKHYMVMKYCQWFKSRVGNMFNEKCILNLSPVQWISGFFNALVVPLLSGVKLQTSASTTVDHVIDIINEYKPASALMSPTLGIQILKNPKKCDLTCFRHVSLTGSRIPKDLLPKLRERVGAHGIIEEVYGMTETFGPCMRPDPNGPPGNCGRPNPEDEVKLVNPDSREEITKPYESGELLIRGKRFFGYYKMPEETKKTYDTDGFFKTGDLLYRDENNYYFYVDRIKMLIKYKNYHIIPVELEDVLSKLEGVEDVAVTSVPDAECGELPVACVVRSRRSTITAQEVKDAIAIHLSDSKRLRGGVIFLDALPRTSTGKTARAKLRQLATISHRE